MYKMVKVKKNIQPTVHNSCYLAYLDHQGSSVVTYRQLTPLRYCLHEIIMQIL